MHIIALFLSLSLSTAQPVVKTNNPEAAPKETVIDFLKWYRTNYDEVMNIPLVKGGVYDKSAPDSYYSVDFVGTEQYLEKLKKSGFVSDVYLKTWRQYFIDSDEQLALSKQNDGPPEGFDYDLIMLAQDFDLAMIEQAKVSEKIESDSATVVVEFPYGYILQYTLTKSGNGWIIDAIENMSS